MLSATIPPSFSSSSSSSFSSSSSSPLMSYEVLCRVRLCPRYMCQVLLTGSDDARKKAKEIISAVLKVFFRKLSSQSPPPSQP